MQMIKILQYLLIPATASVISVAAHAYDYQAYGIGITRDNACNDATSTVNNAQSISSCYCKNVKDTYWTCTVDVERKRAVYNPPRIYTPPSYSTPRAPVTFSRPGAL